MYTISLNPGAALYLDLLKRCVTNTIYEDEPIPSPLRGGSNAVFDRQARLEGLDWPSQAHTMIGMDRLDNLQTLIEEVLQAGVPGDLIETGVWRGGATIFMRGVLKAYGVTDRLVWVADSFQGFPPPERDTHMPQTYSSPEIARIFAVQREHPEVFRAIEARLFAGSSYEEVCEHFERYGLLDDQVRFLRGWFRDTLPTAPIERLALMRLDSDFYESTYGALAALYPRLSKGGYTIIDDYGSFSECRQAVHDYLSATGKTVDIQTIHQGAVYWQKRD
jgi:hypothetical protein